MKNAVDYNRTHYVHERVEDTGVDATYAYRFVETTDGNIVVAVGMTFCSPKDNFCKATGRQYALARLEAGLRQLDTHPNPVPKFAVLELSYENYENYIGHSFPPQNSTDYRKLERFLTEDFCQANISCPAAWNLL